MERLKALELFRVVAELGNFSRAAELSGISGAAVSRAIKELEAWLGVRLLHRTTRNVILTEIGQSVLDRTVAVLDGYDSLEAIGRDDAQQMRGTIRLGVHALYGTHRILQALKPFSESNPGVRIELCLIHGASAPLDQIADLAITTCDSIPPSFVARLIDTIDFALYSSPGFLARCSMPTHPRELNPLDCMCAQDDSGKTRFDLLRLGGIEKFVFKTRGFFLSNSPDVVAQATSQDVGIALLPVTAAQPYVERGEIVPVLSEWQARPLDVALAYRSRHLVPMRVRRLIDHLTRVFSVEGNEIADTKHDVEKRASDSAISPMRPGTGQPTVSAQPEPFAEVALQR